MKYLCLGYYDAEAMDARPPAEIEALMSQCRPHMAGLYGSGRVLVDAGLDLETRSLRRVGGQVEVTADRVVESRLKIGGVFIVEADDLDDAMRVARLHPTTRVSDGEAFGWAIEIRPIHTWWEDPSRA